LADGLSAIGQRLSVFARNIRDVYLLGNDPDYDEALGINFAPLKLFKHPLSSQLPQDDLLLLLPLWRG
jgi:hypothetical protein